MCVYIKSSNLIILCIKLTPSDLLIETIAMSEWGSGTATQHVTIQYGGPQEIQ